MTCSDFTYQEDAQAAFRAGETQLDGDSDGIACESLPHRPSTTPSPAPAAGTPAIAQGVYTGTLTGSSSTVFEMIALENGDFWALYGVPVGSSLAVRGFVHGGSTQAGSSFSSTSARDYSAGPTLSATISGTITGSAIVGTLAELGGSVSFSGAPPLSSTYNYNRAANLAEVTGAWNLRGLDGTAVTVTVANNGSFSGSNGGCLISGRVTPRASGKNVFDVSVTSGGAPCIEPGGTSTGIGVTYLLQNSSTRQLVVAVVNAGQTSGKAFFGTR